LQDNADVIRIAVTANKFSRQPAAPDDNATDVAERNPIPWSRLVSIVFSI
jgi:hypothetical protein